MKNALRGIQSLFSGKRKPKVKLVAIAKDESAYLSDWIFHHLYFGVDSISIYVNNTSDNTWELAKSLGSLKQVSFIDGDKFFKNTGRAPQALVYTKELKKSRRQGYSHVLFLDVDEFWTPKSFIGSIKDFAVAMWADVLCFEWINRVNEMEPFASPVSSTIEGVRAPQVKSLIRTSTRFSSINPHSVHGKFVTHQLANGDSFDASLENFSRVPAEELKKSVKSAFVIHRMYRSEAEYVSMLGRGRPFKNKSNSSIFKNNRKGYIPEIVKSQNINFPNESVSLYESERNLFLERHNLKAVIAQAREYVGERREDTIKLIRKAPAHEAATLKKILANVCDEDVKTAYQHFLQRVPLS